ncbi:unnamed protein product [Didymodactylos carnosus]|uniref:RBR-type E3 ubiquitin transferase n=1 Tax=Didymodactylos carnosus TaxID=1234261 RepID=A0A814UZM2_9BILA|nr:unnamed protein product [Didymodactylos carnosus]CAF1183013.1 unnamed protein product [Didymodactylos carnosus]CAF3806559.1 unnamed protein product [Didymodactylos carnosus]CAF3947389.1 unnamed protein product [Didymodactylos carnosus]
MGKIHKEFENELEVEIEIIVVKHQMRITGEKMKVIQCEEKIKENWKTMPKLILPTSNKGNSTVPECVICMNDANYCLQGCGHPYCRDCLIQYLSTKFDTSLGNEKLKITCVVDKCNSLLLIRDIKTILGATNLSKLARASFQAFLKTDKDMLRCIGDDCNQIYRESKHPDSYVCDGCSKMYCVKCKVEYHTGVTCESYQEMLKKREEENRLSKEAMETHGYKPCPSCKAYIEKTDGCNAMRCNCGIGFCWLCGFTAPRDAHPHFADKTSPCYGKIFDGSNMIPDE